MSKPTPPLAPVLVQPFERPVKEELPVAVTTLAELLHTLGTRSEVAQAWGMAPRTLAQRMNKPETASLEELQRLASLAKLDLPTVFRLAHHQMQHPQPVPPTSGPGRPVRQH